MNSPLFDIYDPQGALGDQQEYDPLTGTFKKRKPRLEDLLPEQEKASMLGQLANAGASGLSAFGWLLDTPGAVVRGTLSGGLGKGLSALIEDSEDRVTGRELLRQYGLVGDEDNWGNFGSGLATELLLDPLTYASLGATALLKRGAQTAAGRAAERAALLSDDVGLLAERAARTGVVDNIGPATFMRNATPEAAARLQADEAAELAGRGIDDPMVRTSQMDAARAQAMLDARAAFNQVGGTDALWSSPLARSNRVTIPYVVNDAFDLWDNVIPGAGDALARTSDNLGIAAQRTPILGGALRAANALIDPKLFGFQDERGQRLGRRLTERGNQFGREIDREIADVSVDVARDIGEDLYRSQEFADAFGMAGENQMGMVKNPRMVAALNSPAGQRLLRFAEDVKRRAREEADRYGIPLERVTLPNDIEYFPRQAVEVVNPRTAAGWAAKPLSPLRGTAIASVSDGGKAARRDYTRAFPRWVLDDMARSGDLQKALRDAPDTDVERIIDEWLAGNAADFTPIASGQRVFDYMADGIDPGDFSPEALAKAEQVAARQRQAYKDLADSLRRSPLQMAEQQIPRFGNSINDLTSYARRQAQRQATADVLLGEMADPENVLRQAADEVPGGAVYSAEDALRTFGFDLDGIDEFKASIAAGKDVRPPPGVRALAERLGIPPNELLTNVSFGREFIDKLNTKIVKARSPAEAAPLLKAIDWYTQSFKQLALLWPARYTRDAYSGSFAGATKGAYSPLDWAAGARAGGGNYDAIAARLENAPGYRESDLFPSGATSPEELREARIRKFLKGAGGVALTQSNVVDDVGRQVNNLAYREQYPGGAGGFLQGLREKFRRNPIPWDLYTNRTSAGNSNWLLDLGDRAASFTDAGNRIGSYLTRIRRGDAPLAAKRIADLTQVNYSPSNFTSFERDFLKRIFPFYSYTKGITPLIFNELTENPAGLMGQSIRVVNRSSEPSENQFTPEYLRQSAAIPLDGAVPFLGLETPGITRFLTNVDLPHESVLNLFTPGVSNTLPGTIGGALAKTGSNILGQSNPLIKGPLEYVLNRQFYSGRQLSDLYSVLEQSLGPTGRGLEQVAVNLPGGSRVIGAFRQAIDQRISPQERAAKFLFNALTGLKLQDVDQEKTVRLAARTTLNDLLDQAPGMSTYENLFIKPEDLVKLSPEEKRQYLLYRVLQAEASRNARERKKTDALAPFGL